MKRRLRPPRSLHWKPRKPKEKDAAFRLPTSQEGAGGAGSGWGRPAEDSTLAAQNLFSLSPDSREDAGKCSFVSSRKSACDGRGRAAGLPAGRRPGGTRTTSPYSAGASGAGFALPGHRVREPVEGLSKPKRGDLRAPRCPPDRPLRRGAAGRARAPSARSCQGHGGGWVGPLCIPKQRAHLSAPPPPPTPPPASSPGVSMEVALTA